MGAFSDTHRETRPHSKLSLLIYQRKVSMQQRETILEEKNPQPIKNTSRVFKEITRKMQEK